MRSGGQPAKPRDQSNVRLNRPVREKSGVLNDVAHAAAQLDRIPLRGGAPFEADLTSSGGNQAVDTLEEGGLARPAPAEQDDRLAGCDVQGNFAQDGAPSQTTREAANFEQWGFGHYDGSQASNPPFM